MTAIPAITERPGGTALGDAWTITRRQFWHWRAQPGAFAVGLLFPVLVTLMFGALFGGAIAGPSTEYAGSYYDFLMPGIFSVAMLFGLESTMTAVNADAAKGVTDRFRSLPISPAAVVLGRCIADMINSVLGLVVLVASGLLLGWRWTNGIGAALAAFGLLLLLRFALLWVGIFLGLKAKGPESVAAVQILVWPISMLSATSSSTRRRCPVGWARSRPGTRCRRPPPRPASCSAIRAGTTAAGWRRTRWCWPPAGRC